MLALLHAPSCWWHCYWQLLKVTDKCWRHPHPVDLVESFVSMATITLMMRARRPVWFHTAASAMHSSVTMATGTPSNFSLLYQVRLSASRLLTSRLSVIIVYCADKLYIGQVFMVCYWPSVYGLVFIMTSRIVQHYRLCQRKQQGFSTNILILQNINIWKKLITISANCSASCNKYCFLWLGKRDIAKWPTL